MRTALLSGGLAFLAVASPAANAEDAFTVSTGVSTSRFAPQSVFAELELLGAELDVRLKLPYSMYGQLQIRSEDGSGSIIGPNEPSDYIRVLIEGGYERKLIWGFVGNAGLHYAQSDIDLGGVLEDPNVTVGFNREGIGARVGLSRDFGRWFAARAEMEYSPIEQAIGGVFDVETARFGPWGLALQFSKYPFLTQASMMLRYHFVAGPPSAPLPPAPEADAKKSNTAGVPQHLAGTAKALSFTSELGSAPIEAVQFTPPPGCDAGDYEVLSPRCDAPVFPTLNGQPRWISDAVRLVPEDPGCERNDFEVIPTRCDAPFRSTVPWMPEWGRDAPLPD